MSLIDIIALLAAVSLGLSSVFFGKRAFREAKLGNITERQSFAVKQLQEWRDARLVVMSEEAFQWTVAMGEHHPQQLFNLVGAIQRIVDREDFAPEDAIMLEVKVEYEQKAAPAAKPDPTKGHLELVATFA